MGVDTDQPGSMQEAVARLKTRRVWPLGELLRLWRSYQGREDLSAELRRELGAHLLRVGEPLMAYDVLSAGPCEGAEGTRLRQLMALALSRSGASDRANGILRRLYEEGARDGETLGILARTHKDLAEQSPREASRRRHLQQAYRFYAEAYHQAAAAHSPDDALYNGINAATTALLLGQEEEARVLAAEVELCCRAKLEQDRNYWALATLGETALIQGRIEEAQSRYREAGAFGRGRYGDLCATRRNAGLLARHLLGERCRFDACFAVPVVLTTGPTAGAAGRETSEEAGAAWRGELRRQRAEGAPAVAYAGATCARDLAFAEAAIEEGCEVHLVLPAPAAAMTTDPAGERDPADWRRRLAAIVAGASRVTVAGTAGEGPHPVVCRYADLMRRGLAALRARTLDTRLVSLPAGIEARGGPPPGRRTEGKPERRLAAILIADVARYGRLSDEQFPRFERHFMGGVRRRIDAAGAPTVVNSWGDALYLVFDSVCRAGRFALDLCDWLRSVSWSEKGLPPDLDLRVALHAGPVYFSVDPVTGRHNCIGSHVVKAARIEPITPPGRVYASESFAALAAVEAADAFRCDYVGRTPLAKQAGVLATYHVRRATPCAAGRDAPRRRALTFRA